MSGRRYVLYGPLGEADRWRDEHPEVRDRDILFVWADPRPLRGLSGRDTTVVRLPGYVHAPAAARVEPLLQLLEVCAPAGVVAGAR